MVLGKLPVPGRPTVWMIVGQGPIALAVGAGGGCLDIFTLLYPFSPLSPSLWETARYRLKYCLKGPLNPKQPTKIMSYCLTFQTMRLYLQMVLRMVTQLHQPVLLHLKHINVDYLTMPVFSQQRSKLLI